MLVADKCARISLRRRALWETRRSATGSRTAGAAAASICSESRGSKTGGYEASGSTAARSCVTRCVRERPMFAAHQQDHLRWARRARLDDVLVSRCLRSAARADFEYGTSQARKTLIPLAGSSASSAQSGVRPLLRSSAGGAEWLERDGEVDRDAAPIQAALRGC